jgi:pimeloyl-ACP methyl ester carboxylesterase
MTVSKHTTPDGIEICYEIFGEDNNVPPMVLISGAGLQMLGWPDEFCKSLAKYGGRVIRFDNRDTGESSILDYLSTPVPWGFALMHKLGLKVSSPYSLEDMAADLIHLLDGLNIEKAHLIGISLGGMIAQVAAINSSDRVKSLTCIGTQARNSRHTMPKIKTVFKILRSPKPGRQGYIDWSIDLIRTVGGTAAERPDDYLREISGRMFDRGISEDGLNRQVCAVYAAPDRRPALSKISTKTLVIHGAEDPLISPEAGKEISTAIPGAKFVLVDGMGHGILRPTWPKLIELITEHILTAS